MQKGESVRSDNGGSVPEFAKTACFPKANSEVVKLLQESNYMKVWQILKEPFIDGSGLKSFWPSVLPYVIQRLKLWNGNALHPQSLSTLLKQEAKQEANKASDPFASDESDESDCEMIIQNLDKYSVSRLDCIAYLVNTADCFVLQTIIRTLSQFHTSLPMIVPDFQQKGSYLVTIPVLHSIIIKWEAIPGQVTESHLFLSPFRLIVAIRLGSHSIGKSTILNQLMANSNMFSSCMEPTSHFGRPLTLEGAVEIVWLTQETLSTTTWKLIGQEHYQKDERLALLANLHGDASHFKETIKYLQQMASSFLVFLMPNSSKEQWEAFKSYVGEKPVVYIRVDPKAKKLKETDIDTSSLSGEITQEKVRRALNTAWNADTCVEVSRVEDTKEAENSLRYIEDLKTDVSQKVIDFVAKYGCCSIKHMIKNILTEKQDLWNEDINYLVRLCLKIFSKTDIRSLKNSFFYLENELSRLSVAESVAARRQVNEANSKLLRMVKTLKPDIIETDSQQKGTKELDLEEARKEKRVALERLEDMNLGLEHFSRLFCHLFKRHVENEITELLPSHFADLLIDGQAIELLNGDSGEIELEWIKAIFNSLHGKLPNLTVFVLSIIGLQSTGKSTLLNALFSFKLAVSTGRCTRGLFMRMVFLDEELKQSHGFDAILLIDSEGLCSPEKMNDPKASQKDRLMATLAFGISNLTIVNILGESMTEMTEILQIAIVAVARLRERGHKPDMLLVQHLPEQNSLRMEQTNLQFCESLNRAFELIRKNDVEIASACFECLDTLTKRIQAGDLFHQFGAFKSGSSISSPPSEIYLKEIANLYSKILARSGESKFKLSFADWTDLLETYWTCVKDENFALNFKNVAHITEFLYFQKALSKVIELMESSFRVHKTLLCKKVRERVNTLITGVPEIQIAEGQRLIDEIDKQLMNVPYLCFEACDKCPQFVNCRDALFSETKGTEWEMDIKHSLEKLKTRLHESAMKMLKQSFDGSLVRQGCFFEFSDLIGREMTRLLKERPDGAYTKEEQKGIEERIWNLLQEIAKAKDVGDDLDTRMQSALKRAYVENGVFPGICENFHEDISVDRLMQEGSFLANGEIFSQKLTLSQLNELSEIINKLIHTILAERKIDCFENGIDFEEGMVTEIRNEFPNQMKKYEETAGLQLNDKFKTKYLQVYALQQLRIKMEDLQRKWDRENKPSEILNLKKDEYMKEIKIRLESGFSSAGEGRIVADKLLKAIKREATKSGYRAQLEYAKSVSWTNDSEAVRLHYFENLALQVKAGNKNPAIEHFLAPQDSIEKWYKAAINELGFRSRSDAEKKYADTFKYTLERALKEIESMKHKADAISVVRKYLENDDDQYLSTFDTKDDAFDLYQHSIEQRLREILHSNQEETIDIAEISEDPEIKDRLGCTEHCHWCGALCWGFRGHQSKTDMKGELFKHHSCHQPCGLKGIVHHFYNALVARACHNVEDYTEVHFHAIKSFMPWEEAKRLHFSDWLFSLHRKNKFDEMMRWFFQELHKDLAEKRNVRPALDEELAEQGCTNLNLDSILESIRTNK